MLTCLKVKVTRKNEVIQAEIKNEEKLLMWQNGIIDMAVE